MLNFFLQERRRKELLPGVRRAALHKRDTNHLQKQLGGFIGYVSGVARPVLEINEG